jgi:hypothetical protein
MIRIPKEIADKMVEDILIQISTKIDVTNQFAEDSLKIINNNTDNQVFTGILFTKVEPSLFNDNEIDMKLFIASCIQTVLINSQNCPSFDFNKDLAKHFSLTNEDKCLESTKLQFALNQFVNAFYEFERLEKKYPELMKYM